MKTVLKQVVTNAITFNVSSEPTVLIAGVAEHARAVITVADNGIGIGAAHRERVFDLFQRLNTREEYAGTGTGLALCRRLVDLQGGTVEVAARWLSPARPSRSPCPPATTHRSVARRPSHRSALMNLTDPPAASSAAADDQPDPGTQETLRLLHVEDNPADALLMQEYIRSMLPDVEFDTAERLSDLTPDRAGDGRLRDPGPVAARCDGLEALIALRAMSENLPIIVLTGFDDLEVGLSALRYGADDYLVKRNVDGLSLDRAVQYAIARRHLTLKSPRPLLRRRWQRPRSSWPGRRCRLSRSAMSKAHPAPRTAAPSPLTPRPALTRSRSGSTARRVSTLFAARRVAGRPIAVPRSCTPGRTAHSAGCWCGTWPSATCPMRRRRYRRRLSAPLPRARPMWRPRGSRWPRRRTAPRWHAVV